MTAFKVLNFIILEIVYFKWCLFFLVSCLLDVMSLDLVNMDLYAGTRHSSTTDKLENKTLEFGNARITKVGPSLLPNKCHLRLQIDRNLDTHLSREVPDISIKGTLEKLEASLDMSQYQLIRGLLSYNIGENLQDLTYVNQTNELFGNILNQVSFYSVCNFFFTCYFYFIGYI